MRTPVTHHASQCLGAATKSNGLLLRADELAEALLVTRPRPYLEPT